MTLFDFKDKTALVTGAPGGIGRGITKALLANGARVIATGPEQDELDTLTTDFASHSERLHCICADLSSQSGWRALAEDAISFGGGSEDGQTFEISIFVHSASPRRHESQSTLEVTEDEWDAMVNTNLRSGFFLGRAIANRMIARKRSGSLLYITSLHKHTPRNLPHYSASKAGQAMVVRELARALGEYGIRVNGIAPGAVPGGGFTMDADSQALFSQRIALGRPGTPDEIAHSALTLLSEPHSGYVTGEVLAVDGGLDLYNWIERP